MTQYRNFKTLLQPLEAAVLICYQKHFADWNRERSLYDHSNKVFTQKLFEDIGKCVTEIGKKQEKDWEPWYTGVGGEWLYDLCICEMGKCDKPGFNRLILALESEQSSCSWDEIYWDFQKLLVTNADYRIMICMPPRFHQDFNGLQDWIQAFENAVANFDGLPAHSRLLVLVWPEYHGNPVRAHLIIKQ